MHFLAIMPDTQMLGVVRTFLLAIISGYSNLDAGMNVFVGIKSGYSSERWME
jgi:hypothetical protein